MQTRRSAENGLGPGCPQQPGAQPSPGQGQSQQGEELAAHPAGAGDVLGRTRHSAHPPVHLKTAGQGRYELPPS